jgi:phosphoglycerate dehydrogenase-like enzyme
LEVLPLPAPVLLSSMPFSPEQVEALQGVRVVLASDRPAFAAALPEAEIVVGRLGAEDLPKATRLRWLQVPFTGVESVPLRELADRGVTVTNIHEQADSMADHSIMLILALARSLADCVRAQGVAEWRRAGVGELAGRTLLAAGFGAVGRGVAVRARACGMRVIGLRQNPAPDPLAEEVIGPADLLRVLPRVDAIANSLPLTPATRGMFGAEAFAALPPGALYVNVGRGPTADEDALAAALVSGHLGGAGLDVFATEPLPPEHPLWRAPRTIITPHLGGHQRDRGTRVHALLADNVRRFLAGLPLRNLVDPVAGY